jgi:lipase
MPTRTIDRMGLLNRMGNVTGSATRHTVRCPAVAVLSTRTSGDPDAPALVAVHGVTGHARRWERLATERWGDRFVVAVDLRGHGSSTWDAPFNVDQHVEDVLDTLDGLDLATADLVGHSFGGLVAVHLLARAPGCVRRLVLLDPAIETDPAIVADQVAGALDDPGWDTVEAATLDRNGGLGDEIHPSVPVEIAQHLVLGDDGRYRFRYDRGAAIVAFTELARPLPHLPETRPTLLVGAMGAPFVTPVLVERLTAAFGDDLRVESLDCGHMVYWERFDDVADLVDGFLA